MISRGRILRFTQKPLLDKWGAIRATLRHMGRHLVAASRQAIYMILTERAARRRVFREIYRNRIWGTGARSQFFSGPGSRGEPARVYVDCMAELLSQHAFELHRPLTIVDLGCGDFEIGHALTTRLPNFSYVGCDIVPELIAHHTRTYATEHIRFQQLDLVCDPLPEGDVCLIRQVLQHLSNTEIMKLVQRLRYQFVYITEGHPSVRIGMPNPDMAAGHRVRFDPLNGRGRGVELDKPPYCLSTNEALRVSNGPHEIIITERILNKSGDCQVAQLDDDEPFVERDHLARKPLSSNGD
jgi:hypothetical protein